MSGDAIGRAIRDGESRMAKAVQSLEEDLAGVRTGRASPALVEKIHVEYYGSEMPLNQMANVSVPEARVIAIQPWDRGAMPAIEKAILKSDLGLTPNNDGQIIRITLPQLTQDRRKELVKVVHRRLEEGRVAIRNVRRDVLDHFKQLRKENLATEDDVRGAEARLQKLTDRYVADADKVGQRKEAEILEV
jgi:ribosome recycling factor